MNTTVKKLHLVTYGLGNRIDIGKIEPIANHDHVKPSGGLWASPVGASFGWREWCDQESFGDTKTNFKFWYSGNILTIDSRRDANNLLWRTAYGAIEFPDFESMLRYGVDAIHLTQRGENETRLTIGKSLYGWDCECVLIMNPVGITA